MPPTVFRPLRRNGKLQACEACRKLKIKCDHSLPSCVRCTEKQIRCIYASARTTRGFRPVTFGDRPRVSPVVENAVIETPISQEPSVSADPVSSIARSPSVVPEARSPQPRANRALISEHHQATRELPSNAEDHTLVHNPLNPQLIYLGVQVLEFVHRNLPLLRNLVAHLYGFNYLPILPESVLLPEWDSLWYQLGSFDLANDSAKTSLVARIFHRSHRPTDVTESTSLRSLHRLIGGDNLRWDTIGNVLMLASCDLLHIHYRDLVGVDPRQRELAVLRSEFQQVTEAFTQLTSNLPMCDELGLCLKYNRFLLAYHQSDDSGEYVLLEFSLGPL